MTPSEILQDIAPELSEVVGRDTFLELAEAQTGAVFRSARNHAVALLAAHMMTLSKRKGVSGGVNSLKEGDLSIGYGRVNPMGTEVLETTSYGAELVRLRQQYIFAARTVLM